MRRMDACTVNILRQTNNRFYEAQAASFSRTRQAPWPGWRCVLDAVCPGWRDRQEAGAPGAHEARGASEDPPHRGLSLVDLACGNLRFEAFLSAEAPGLVARTLAVDDCDPLVARGTRAGDVSFSSLDAVDALAGGSLAADLDALLAEPADLAVCFGFAHHVPGAEMRADLLRALVSAVRPGGAVALSFWRFLRDPQRAASYRQAHERNCAALAAAEPAFDAAALEPGDCLLGWRDTDAIRYCHSFSDADLAALAACDSRAQVVAHFDADGRTGCMNAYLVFRRMR
jgi:tRNA (uracil-5-)-methyltransferase TRM9